MTAAPDIITTAADRRRRLWILAVLTLLVGLVLAGCGSDDPGPETKDPMPSSTAQRPAATFDADVQVGDESVSVSYSLTNTGAQPITVLDPDPPYVTGDDDQIFVSQQVFPRPDTDRKTWETSATTAATTVAAGQTVHGKVSVPRPFVRLHPYGNDIGYGEIDLPGDPSSVRFCLGVIATPLVDGDTRDGGDGLLVVNDDSTFERQYLSCADPAALE